MTKSSRGRFAPTPSGPLHVGSLVTAVASYCSVKSKSGEWLVRIEDVDGARCHAKHTKDILKTLEQFGLDWDSKIEYQSERSSIYQSFLDQLISKKQAYFCNCSRKQIGEGLGRGVDGSPIYSGRCLASDTNILEGAVRLHVYDGFFEFEDFVFGSQKQNVSQEVGDFVLKRSDGYFAYHLAVVVDDALQNITEVVRGYDLLVSTPRHLVLQNMLGFINPLYGHVPLVLNSDGQKLSKQTLAPAISYQEASRLLFFCLQFLGQKVPTELKGASAKELLSWGALHWNWGRVPKIFGEFATPE